MISVTEAQIMAWLSPVIWPFVRVLAVFTAAPIFSNRAFPVRARILLALFITMALQASLPPQPVVALNDPAALGVLLQQIGIGLSIGFVVRLVFTAIEFAGEIIGLQMGLNFAAFFDPVMAAQSSATARFYGYMALLLFIAMNGHLMVVMAVARSFEVFPVDQNFLQVLAGMKLYSLGAELFASALWIALPVVAMLVFVNLTLGIVSRIAPQVNVFAIGFPITLVVGLVGMAVTLPMLDRPMLALMDRAISIFTGG